MLCSHRLRLCWGADASVASHARSAGHTAALQGGAHVTWGTGTRIRTKKVIIGNTAFCYKAEVCCFTVEAKAIKDAVIL